MGYVTSLTIVNAVVIESEEGLSRQCWYGCKGKGGRGYAGVCNVAKHTFISTYNPRCLDHRRWNAAGALLQLQLTAVNQRDIDKQTHEKEDAQRR